tara:strand:- start:246 stop:380 length:135 start_codon:yes stop_codon:yes gene_type:complete
MMNDDVLNSDWIDDILSEESDDFTVTYEDAILESIDSEPTGDFS